MKLSKIPKLLWVTIVGLIVWGIFAAIAAVTLPSILGSALCFAFAVLDLVLIFGLISGRKWAFWG
jgi:hypothetical protein